MVLKQLNSLILEWWPWLNLWSDSFFLQLIIFYSLFLIYFSTNIFYVVFYFFLVCLYFGLFLCIYQVELFTGFLWLAECVIIFVVFLLLFFLKTSGTFSRLLLKVKAYKYATILLILVVYLLQPINFNFLENLIPIELNIVDFWDNFYEALSNTNINDFIVFLISYYTINSHILLILIFIILIASVVCVNLNKINKDTRVRQFDILLKIIDFFKYNVFFIFMRQQNLTDQENQPAGTRIFKKKIKI